MFIAAIPVGATAVGTMPQSQSIVHGLVLETAVALTTSRGARCRIVTWTGNAAAGLGPDRGDGATTAGAPGKWGDRTPQRDDPVLIGPRQNGARTRAMDPRVPATPEALGEDAIRCWDAGAAAIHVRNASFDLRGGEAAGDCTPDRGLIL